MVGNILGFHVRTIGLVPMLLYFAAYFVGAVVVRARQEPPPALPLLGLRARRDGDAGQGAGGHRAARHRARGLARRRRALARHLPQARDPARRRALHRRRPAPGTTRCSSATASPFWKEFIGDNYVHRAQGRHGDRGTFEYYIQYLGYGMFPWSGIATARRGARVHAAARAVAARAARRLRARLVPRRVLDGVAGQHQVPPLHPAGAAGAGHPRRPVPRRRPARADEGAAVGAWRSSACR